MNANENRIKKEILNNLLGSKESNITYKTVYGKPKKTAVNCMMIDVDDNQ